MQAHWTLSPQESWTALYPGSRQWVGFCLHQQHLESGGKDSRRNPREETELKSKLPSLFNDVLIALASLQIGATLYTTNAQDFKLIQRYRAFELKILD